LKRKNCKELKKGSERFLHFRRLFRPLSKTKKTQATLSVPSETLFSLSHTTLVTPAWAQRPDCFFWKDPERIEKRRRRRRKRGRAAQPSEKATLKLLDPRNSPSPLSSPLRFSLNAPGTPNNAVAAGTRANKISARAI
jgi:hypothetical protein